jgi:hypothetical protein
MGGVRFVPARVGNAQGMTHTDADRSDEASERGAETSGGSAEVTTTAPATGARYDEHGKPVA